MQADLETTRQLAPLVQERLKRLDEIVPLVDFLFAEEIHYDPKLLIGNKMSAAESLAALRMAGETLDMSASFDDEAALEQQLRAAADALGLKPAQFFGVLRVAVTGKTVTPPLVGTMRILGKNKTMARVGKALALLEQIAAAPV
jgi:glutamyl-tRNA synthetase